MSKLCWESRSAEETGVIRKQRIKSTKPSGCFSPSCIIALLSWVLDNVIDRHLLSFKHFHTMYSYVLQTFSNMALSCFKILTNPSFTCCFITVKIWFWLELHLSITWYISDALSLIITYKTLFYIEKCFYTLQISLICLLCWSLHSTWIITIHCLHLPLSRYIPRLTSSIAVQTPREISSHRNSIKYYEYRYK